MDEIELRIAALELAVIEVFSDLPRAELERARGRIGVAIFQSGDADETAVREAALKLIEDAEDRHVVFK